MGGPKHLWSGDWEQESEAQTARLRPAAADTPPVDETAPTPSGSTGRRRRVRLARLGLLGLVLAGGLAWGLTALLGGSGHKPASAAASVPGTQTTPRSTPPQFQPSTPTTPQATPNPTPNPTTPKVTPIPIPSPTPAPSTPPGGSSPQPAQPAPAGTVGPTVTWLGMQISTLSTGVVVIDTVALGSVADRAGLEPGEDITSVAGRPLRSATDIASAIRGQPSGHSVPVEISYGSSAPQRVELRLGAPPVSSP